MTDPNQFVFCCGMIRSGSTVIYQIAAAIVEIRRTGKRYGYYEPPASHAPEQAGVFKIPWMGPRERRLARAGATVLYSHRALDDAIASAARAFRLSERDAALWRGIAQRHHWAILDHEPAFPRLLVTPFALICADLLGTVEQIAKWLPGRTLTSEEILSIHDDLCLARQRARPKAEPFDPHTLLFPSHFN